jgi:hypothetical protein
MKNHNLAIYFNDSSFERQVWKVFILIAGFLIGWFGTHYVVTIFYPIVGPICLWGIHLHHLYIGLIGAGLILGLYSWNRLKQYRPFLLFFLALSLGIFFDDIITHFVLQTAPFEWFCE